MGNPSIFPNRSRGQILIIGFPTIWSVFSEPQTRESMDTEPQSPNTNTSFVWTRVSPVCMNFLMSPSGSASQRLRFPRGDLPLTSTDPAESDTATVSPGPAAMRLTKRSRPSIRPPLEETMFCNLAGGWKRTTSSGLNLLLLFIILGVTLSTRRTSPTRRVGSIDLEGMTKRDTACEMRKAAVMPSAAVQRLPIADTALYALAVYNLGNSVSATRTGQGRSRAGTRG
mmetsp:Transcript_21062/g.30368  ORF Transcript_21062/g.30368 Transcript_21062/m.30368 type:complete len:227 (+) Transcript_21062:49-729(+)